MSATATAILETPILETPTPETPIIETQSPERPSIDERKELLARAVADQVREGWRVEARSNTQSVMVKGQRPNHVLHLILTIVTAGLWAPVWIALTIFGGEKRMGIEIDAYGNTNLER
jgi:hypothetical protein